MIHFDLRDLAAVFGIDESSFFSFRSSAMVLSLPVPQILMLCRVPGSRYAQYSGNPCLAKSRILTTLHHMYIVLRSNYSSPTRFLPVLRNNWLLIRLPVIIVASSLLHSYRPAEVVFFHGRQRRLVFTTVCFSWSFFCLFDHRWDHL